MGDDFDGDNDGVCDGHGQLDVRVLRTHGAQIRVPAAVIKLDWVLAMEPRNVNSIHVMDRGKDLYSACKQPTQVVRHSPRTCVVHHQHP